MNVISQPDNLSLSYSQKPSFCFNISSPFSPAVRTIRYYRSIGFHPNQRKKSGTCGLLQGEALLWLGNDLWDGGSITKSHEHLPASACTESWHSDERCQGGTNKSVLPIHSSNVVYPCGLQRICVCVSAFLRPSGTPNYLPPPREFDAKMCAVKWDSVGECVSSTSHALAQRGQLRMITSEQLHFFLCWKVCHTSNIVSDIRKCLLTVGALSSSHFNICLLTQTTKKVTRVILDHIITQKLFFSIASTNLKMASQMHLNCLAILCIMTFKIWYF